MSQQELLTHVICTLQDLGIEYIAKWTKELGVVDLWEQVVAEAEPFNPDAFE